MSRSLAVFTHQLGSFSETFVRRHIEELLPRRTVVVSKIEQGSHGGHWTVDCPKLILEHFPKTRLRYQILTAALRSAGFDRPNCPDEHTKIVKRFLKDNGVGVVLGEYLDVSLPWISLKRELGLRFFAHAHGYDVSAHLRDQYWRENYLRYNESDGVITMSEVSRARLIAVGIDPNKLHVIPYGVDVPPVPIQRPRRSTVRCVAVGRMTGKKAPVMLLDAFRRAHENFAALELEHVGEGPLMASAIQFIQAFCLEKQVQLHGGQLNDFTQRLLERGDIFVQHSVTDPVNGDEEGLPVAILEAMANGLPVISTRHAGISEAVVDGVTGYLVEEGDSEAMAARVVELARDPDLRQNMGLAGWKRAQENFSWEKERSDLLKLLSLP